MVGYPHDIKGQGIYAYVTLMTGTEPSEALRKELVAWVRKDIGPIASPDLIQFAPGLPKTRSGKIMRRILRKIAEDEPGKPRRHLDAGGSRRGRRSGRAPPEQEGRGGVRTRTPGVTRMLRSAMSAVARLRRVMLAASAALTAPLRRCAASGTRARSSVATRTLTPLSGASRPPVRFSASVVFRSFTLFPTFSFLSLPGAAPGAARKPVG